MNFDMSMIFDIFAALVTVAAIFVILSNENAAKLVSAWGSAFSESVRAATGR